MLIVKIFNLPGASRAYKSLIKKRALRGRFSSKYSLYRVHWALDNLRLQSVTLNLYNI